MGSSSAKREEGEEGDADGTTAAVGEEVATTGGSVSLSTAKKAWLGIAIGGGNLRRLYETSMHMA